MECEKVVNVIKEDMELVVLKDGQRYAKATVISVQKPFKENDKHGVYLRMRNDEGLECSDQFYFLDDVDKPGWYWFCPNNFWDSGLGGPKGWITTEEVFSFIPIL